MDYVQQQTLLPNILRRVSQERGGNSHLLSSFTRKKTFSHAFYCALDHEGSMALRSPWLERSLPWQSFVVAGTNY